MRNTREATRIQARTKTGKEYSLVIPECPTVTLLSPVSISSYPTSKPIVFLIMLLHTWGLITVNFYYSGVYNMGQRDHAVFF